MLYIKYGTPLSSIALIGIALYSSASCQYARPTCGNSVYLITGMLVGVRKWYAHSFGPLDSNTRWRKILESPYCLASLVPKDIVIWFLADHTLSSFTSAHKTFFADNQRL